MAKSSVIKVELKALVSGKEQIVTLSGKLGEVGKAAARAQRELDAISWAAIASGAEKVQSTISGLIGTLQDLSGAYAVQAQVERQLEVVMRNTMSATDDQIQSIKDLCSAQQELGVIGDEVQLQGAQELATYLTMTDSLKTLIPVMNDMIAQQYGLEASGEAAASIATMLGKVMNGQVNALSRYGYTFDEAQEKILKFGTESERAAVLADVVGQSVGGMNAALAQTDIGKQKQLENTLGDIKERMGELANSAMPFVTMAAMAAMAVSGVIKFVAGVKAATAAVVGWNIKGTATSVMLKALGLNCATATTMSGALGNAMQLCSVKTIALKVAVRGLIAATGVGAALMALSYAIDFLSGTTDKANKKTQEWEQELDDLKKEVGDITAATAQYATKELESLDKLYKAATDDAASKKKRVAAIKELMTKYPEYFKGIDAEKIKVSELKKKYELLRDAIIQTARARAAQDKLQDNASKQIDLELQIEDAKKNKGDAEVQLKKAQGREKQAKAQGPSMTAMYQSGAGVVQGTTDYERARAERVAAQKEYNAATETLNQLEEKLSVINEENDKLAKIVSETPLKPDVDNDPTTPPTNPTKTMTEAEKAAALDVTEIMGRNRQSVAAFDAVLSDLRLKQKYAADEEYGAIQRNIEAIEEEKRKWITYASLKSVPGAPTHVGGKMPTAPIKWDVPIRPVIATEAVDKVRTKMVKTLNKMPSPFEWTKSAWGGVKGIASAMDSLNKVLDENASLWERVSGLVDGLLGLYENFKTILDMVTLAKQAETAAKTANIGVTNQETTAEVANAAAKFFSAHAWIPWVGVGLGAAAMAMMVAKMAGLPKFADGGIAYGPTLGLFGEYAGASSNPEVVAPLDKLRTLIGDGGGREVRVTGELKARGGALVAVIRNELRRESR